MAITNSNTTYYIPENAVTLSPNQGGDPSLVGLTVASGSVLIHYDERLWQDLASPLPTDPDGDKKKAAAPMVMSKLGYGADGISYRRWALDGDNIALGEGDALNAVRLYARISPDTGRALLCLTYLDKEPLQWKMKRPDGAEEEKFPEQETPEGEDAPDSRTEEEKEAVDRGESIYPQVPDYENLEYVWVQLGILDAPVNGVREWRELDFGCLGTQKYGEERQAEWYTVDNANRRADMRDGWRFGTFWAHSLKLRRILSGEVKEEWTEAGLLADHEDPMQPDALAESDSGGLTHILVTAGWIVKKFHTWATEKYRAMFVCKDNPNGVEEMQGSLKSRKNITAVDTVQGETVTATEDVNAGGNVNAAGSVYAEYIVQGTALATHGFSAGELTGTGAAMAEVEGTGYIETDILSVRKTAWFRELTIEEVRHVGGEMILSQAACQIARVVGYTSRSKETLDVIDFDSAGLTPGKFTEPTGAGIRRYRLYFEKEAGGKKQWNEWTVGDQARCQSMGGLDGAGHYENVRNGYYWRLVTKAYDGWSDKEDSSIANPDKMHWIDVSNWTSEVSQYDIRMASGDNTIEIIEGAPGCDKDCTTPQPNDSIALLGCRRKEPQFHSRRSAQVYSTAEANSPSRRYYHNITTFQMSSADTVEVLEWNAVSGGTSWRVGDGNSYMSYERKMDGTTKLQIQADEIKFGASKRDLAATINNVATYLGDSAINRIEAIYSKEGAVLPEDAELLEGALRDLAREASDIVSRWQEVYDTLDKFGDEAMKQVLVEALAEYAEAYEKVVE